MSTYELPTPRRDRTVVPRVPKVENIQRKLNIVIPKAEFNATLLSEAIEFLRQEAVRNDPDPEPTRRDLKIACCGLPLSPR